MFLMYFPETKRCLKWSSGIYFCKLFLSKLLWFFSADHSQMHVSFQIFTRAPGSCAQMLLDCSQLGSDECFWSEKKSKDYTPKGEERERELMVPGSLGALPKIGGDGKKTETPDSLRAHPENTWADQKHPTWQEEEIRWRELSGEVLGKWSWYGTAGSSQREDAHVPSKERDAERTGGLDGSLSQTLKTSDSSDPLTEQMAELRISSNNRCQLVA